MPIHWLKASRSWIESLSELKKSQKVSWSEGQHWHSARYIEYWILNPDLEPSSCSLNSKSCLLNPESWLLDLSSRCYICGLNSRLWISNRSQTATTTTKQQKRPEKLFSVSLTFVNTTKKIKGIPLWVYIPSIPCLYLPFFVLLCSKLPEKLSTNPFFVLLLNAEINSHLAFFTDARGFSLCLQMYWFIYQCHTRPVLSNINMKHNNSE